MARMIMDQKGFNSQPHYRQQAVIAGVWADRQHAEGIGSPHMLAARQAGVIVGPATVRFEQQAPSEEAKAETIRAIGHLPVAPEVELEVAAAELDQTEQPVQDLDAEWAEIAQAEQVTSSS